MIYLRPTSNLLNTEFIQCVVCKVFLISTIHVLFALLQVKQNIDVIRNETIHYVCSKFNLNSISKSAMKLQSHN